MIKARCIGGAGCRGKKHCYQEVAGGVVVGRGHVVHLLMLGAGDAESIHQVHELVKAIANWRWNGQRNVELKGASRSGVDQGAKAEVLCRQNKCKMRQGVHDDEATLTHMPHTNCRRTSTKCFWSSMLAMVRPWKPAGAKMGSQPMPCCHSSSSTGATMRPACRAQHAHNPQFRGKSLAFWRLPSVGACTYRAESAQILRPCRPCQQRRQLGEW